MSLYSFEFTGTKKDDLIKALEFILETNKLDIKSFKYSAPENSLGAKKGVMVFAKCCKNLNNWKEYPFNVNAVILAEQIYQYIDSLSDGDLELMGAVPSGCEEDYSVGWKLFSPDWYSDERGIQDYDIFCCLAVKPVICEYGK